MLAQLGQKPKYWLSLMVVLLHLSSTVHASAEEFPYPCFSPLTPVNLEEWALFVPGETGKPVFPVCFGIKVCAFKVQ